MITFNVRKKMSILKEDEEGENFARKEFLMLKFVIAIYF